VTKHLANQKTQQLAIESFESLTGEGVFASHKGDAYFLGSPKLMSSNAIKIDETLMQQAEEWLFRAYTVIWFADKENALAAIAIADKIKDTSAEAVRALQDMNIEVYMLTGDNHTTAESVARQVGIRHFKAESMPGDKAEFIKLLQEKGEKVAMVGDGINDSQALARANVSIAMGKGTDIAMDVAQMTLISSNLAQIPKAIRLSRATVKIIKQNLFWAFIYNIIGIPIAAGILYPFTGFLLNPMFAGAAMALSSISVVSNSLRLKYLKLV
jgi:Cu2+-exporting ATPase